MSINTSINRFPITSVLLLVSFSIFMLKLAPAEKTFGLVTHELTKSGIQIGLIVLYILLFKFLRLDGAINVSAAKVKPSAIRILALIPISLIATINLLSLDWQRVDFNQNAVTVWLFSNITTGLFEEVLMRLVCFSILLRAYGTTPNAVFKAAIWQALIFGIAHLPNMFTELPINVLAQAIYAVFFGFGFAAYYPPSRSANNIDADHSITSIAISQ